MFKFTWRIENFSMLPQNTKEYIDSPVFEVKSMSNVRAYVRLFPKGQFYQNYISLYLHQANESAAFEIGTKVKVSFTKNSISEFNEYVIDSKDANDLRLSFERHLIPEIDAFQDLFLFADNVDIECVFQKPDSSAASVSPVTSCAKTTVQIETHTHDLSLNKFFPSTSWKQSLEYSKNFVVEQSNSFQLALKLQNQFENNTLEISSISELSSEITICCKASLLNAVEKTELICQRHSFKNDTKNDPWKMPFAIIASSMEKFKILRCEIINSKGATVSSIETSNLALVKADATSILCNKSEKNCQTVLKNMYERKLLADVVLQVGADQFAAHKCVLSSVSDVFAAMFTSRMREDETNMVEIIDIDSDIVKKMLHFVYTGKVENVDLKNLISLYSSADKYQILELKKLCSFHLTESLSISSCLEVLELAVLHQDSVLKNAVRSFVYANRKEVLYSENWKCFMEKQSELAADIMFYIFEQTS